MKVRIRKVVKDLRKFRITWNSYRRRETLILGFLKLKMKPKMWETFGKLLTKHYNSYILCSLFDSNCGKGQ